MARTLYRIDTGTRIIHTSAVAIVALFAPDARVTARTEGLE